MPCWWPPGVGWADKIQGTEGEAFQAVELAMELGMDVNAATDGNDTALHGAARRAFVITAYEPSLDIFEPDYRTRRRS